MDWDKKNTIVLQPNMRHFLETYWESVDLLKYIKINEEPCVINNSLQLYDCLPIFEPIYRFFTNQNKYTLFKFLDSKFKFYFKLLDNLLDKQNYTKSTYELIQDTNLFNLSITEGLLILKQTYSTYEDMQFIIDSILFTFRDFNEMKQQYLKTLPKVTKITIRRSSFVN